MPAVVFELYGIARRRAGVESVAVEATTLSEGLRALARHLPALEGEVIVGGRLAPHWRANLGGSAFLEQDDAPLAPGTHVLLLSSLAGG